MDPQHEQIQCTKLGFKKGERDSHQSITNHLPFNSSFFPLKDELSPIHRRSSYGSGIPHWKAQVAQELLARSVDVLSGAKLLEMWGSVKNVGDWSYAIYG